MLETVTELGFPSFFQMNRGSLCQVLRKLPLHVSWIALKSRVSFEKWHIYIPIWEFDLFLHNSNLYTFGKFFACRIFPSSQQFRFLGN